jgi:23S rRNA pseudouridine1911/1915/1917 synthase
MMRLEAEASDAGKRLDHFLQDRLHEFSRSRLQDWIKQGLVLVDGSAKAKASSELRGGEIIEVEPAALPPLKAEPEDLPVDVLYEDDDVVAINKPSGLVVHAGAGHREGTLVNRLVYRFGLLSQVGGEMRPGIVHRLDRETSGVLLVAKTDAAHRNLAEQFANRTTEKIYLALVHGTLSQETGRITSPISRDMIHRTRMTTRNTSGRTALTDYRVLRRFNKLTYLEVRIGTGRTHQIRVHLASIRHPVYGDKLYGAPAAPAGFERFFLHAWRIGFEQPSTSKRIVVEAPLPLELEEVLSRLE